MSQQNSESRRDTVFGTPMGSIPPFSFNEQVATVFDDMADRSIPFYREVQRLTAALAQRYAQTGTTIHDLGCSTGTTISMIRDAISQHGPSNISLCGIDSSEAMCRKARSKLGLTQNQDSRGSAATGATAARDGGSDGDTDREPEPNRTHEANKDDTRRYVPFVSVKESTIEEVSISNASVVIMNYTLQFVPPDKRLTVIRKILNGLLPGGILLITDKMLQTSTDVSRVFVDIYYELKQAQGYSELEIAQKREALENVLIPYRLEEERELLERSGFATVDIYFSWCNFTSLICVKDELS